MDKSFQDAIVGILLRFFPDLQAIYLFGSYGTNDVTDSSDVDIAMLLPPEHAYSVSSGQLFEARCELEQVLRRNVDLVNLREANTVFRHEIIKDLRRIYCADSYAADVFEMLCMSFYQKLNQERAEILDEIRKSGRVLVP